MKHFNIDYTLNGFVVRWSTYANNAFHALDMFTRREGVHPSLIVAVEEWA